MSHVTHVTHTESCQEIVSLCFRANITYVSQVAKSDPTVSRINLNHITLPCKKIVSKWRHGTYAEYWLHQIVNSSRSSKVQKGQQKLADTAPIRVPNFKVYSCTENSKNCAKSRAPKPNRAYKSAEKSKFATHSQLRMEATQTRWQDTPDRKILVCFSNHLCKTIYRFYQYVILFIRILIKAI